MVAASHPVAVRPSPFDDELVGDTPEASGAMVGCDCSQCRERRLVDDERITFNAREYADAWQDGWLTGFQAGFERSQQEGS